MAQRNHSHDVTYSDELGSQMSSVAAALEEESNGVISRIRSAILVVLFFAGAALTFATFFVVRNTHRERESDLKNLTGKFAQLQTTVNDIDEKIKTPSGDQDSSMTAETLKKGIDEATRSTLPEVLKENLDKLIEPVVSKLNSGSEAGIVKLLMQTEQKKLDEKEGELQKIRAQVAEVSSQLEIEIEKLHQQESTAGLLQGFERIVGDSELEVDKPTSVLLKAFLRQVAVAVENNVNDPSGALQTSFKREIGKLATRLDLVAEKEFPTNGEREKLLILIPETEANYHLCKDKLGDLLIGMDPEFNHWESIVPGLTVECGVVQDGKVALFRSGQVKTARQISFTGESKSIDLDVLTFVPDTTRCILVFGCNNLNDTCPNINGVSSDIILAVKGISDEFWKTSGQETIETNSAIANWHRRNQTKGATRGSVSIVSIDSDGWNVALRNEIRRRILPSTLSFVEMEE